MARVLFINTTLPHTIDYPEARPILLARDLQHDVHTIAGPQPGRPAFEGVTMWTAESTTALGRLMHSLQPDVTFYERPGAALATIPLARRAWVRALERRERSSTDMPRRLLAQWARIASFTNPYEARRWSHLRARRVELAYPVDTGFWRATSTRDPTVWDALSLATPTGPVIISVANLMARKQQVLLIEWMAPVLREDPGALLILVGGDVEAAERKRIDETVAGLGLAAQVHLAGYLSPTRVRALYVWAAAAVVNSRSETQCMALYEGLAAGVPTLIFDNPVLSSAFPSLPTHRDGYGFRENLARILADPVAARLALSGATAVGQRCEWADVRRHDLLFQAELPRLLAA